MFVSLRRLYDWMLRLASGRHAEPALAGVSFCSSIFFPIPQDVMLVPMCLARPKRSFRYAAIAMLASVMGGVVAYLLGYFFYEAVARPILEFYEAGDSAIIFRDYYNRYGWLFVLAGGMTPLPYKVIALLSGASGLFLPIFILASLGGRAVRFFSIAILIYLFGEAVKSFIDKYFALVFTALFIALIVGFYAVGVVFDR